MVHATLTYYLECPEARAIELFKDTSSPLIPLGKARIPSFRSKDTSLYATFIISPSDSEIMEQPEHVQLQAALGFQPKSTLHYSLGELSREKGRAFMRIAEYIRNRSTAFYMILEDYDGEPHPIYGHNPRNGSTIRAPALEELLHREPPRLGE